MLRHRFNDTGMYSTFLMYNFVYLRGHYFYGEGIKNMFKDGGLTYGETVSYCRTVNAAIKMQHQKHPHDYVDWDVYTVPIELPKVLKTLRKMKNEYKNVYTFKKESYQEKIRRLRKEKIKSNRRKQD